MSYVVFQTGHERHILITLSLQDKEFVLDLHLNRFVCISQRFISSIIINITCIFLGRFNVHKLCSFIESCLHGKNDPYFYVKSALNLLGG